MCCRHVKQGSIKIHAVDTGEAYSVINPDTCVRCEYVLESDPTDAIKYGQLLPKRLKAEKLLFLTRMFVSVV